MKANVTINTLFVTSAYDMATLKKVKKFRPEALNLYEGEGKEKTCTCTIGVGTKDDIGKYGICFANDAVTGEKVAALSRPVPADLKSPEAIHEWVNEQYGLVIVKCKKVEEQIAAALTEIAVDEASMNEAITVDGEGTTAQ